MTEIAKALMGEVRLLILDEPTSSLTSDEVQILFDAIEKVTRRGVGVIYVTHRLNEVFEISQRVTVLRDGANAGTFVTADTDMKRLVNAIVGTDRIGVQRRLRCRAPQATRSLRVRRRFCPCRTCPTIGCTRVDLSVLKGEIHGLAGLIGSGRTEILETMFGLRPIESGAIARSTVDDGCRRARPTRSTQGIALVPEDRHVQGLVLDHSIERNLTLSRLPYFSRWGWMQQRAAARRAEAAIDKLAVKAQGASSLVRTLSGGNQQKVVFGKWNDPRPRVLLLDEPTVGVDVGAREEIYGVIRQCRPRRHRRSRRLVRSRRTDRALRPHLRDRRWPRRSNPRAWRTRRCRSNSITCFSCSRLPTRRIARAAGMTELTASNVVAAPTRSDRRRKLLQNAAARRAALHALHRLR